MEEVVVSMTRAPARLFPERIIGARRSHVRAGGGNQTGGVGGQEVKHFGDQSQTGYDQGCSSRTQRIFLANQMDHLARMRSSCSEQSDTTEQGDVALPCAG